MPKADVGCKISISRAVTNSDLTPGDKGVVVFDPGNCYEHEDEVLCQMDCGHSCYLMPHEYLVIEDAPQLGDKIMIIDSKDVGVIMVVDKDGIVLCEMHDGSSGWLNRKNYTICKKNKQTRDVDKFLKQQMNDNLRAIFG